MPVPHHSVFYRLDALPAAQPTVSKHWRQHFHIKTQQETRSCCIVRPPAWIQSSPYCYTARTSHISLLYTSCAHNQMATELHSPCGRGLERRVRHTETTGRRQCASGTRSSCSVPLLPTARPSSMSPSLLGINGSLQRTQLYSRPCTQLLVVRSIDTDTDTDTCTHARTHAHTHTHTRLTALFPKLPRWAGTRKVKPVWILLMQETVSGSGISWAVCKSASRSRQITHQEPTTQFFTGRMPFLLPNQQRQSTEVLSLHSPITLTANTSKIAYSCQISDYMTKTKNMPDPV